MIVGRVISCGALASLNGCLDCELLPRGQLCKLTHAHRYLSREDDCEEFPESKAHSSQDMVNPSPEFWNGRRVLVTGHTGFKGAWLWQLLLALGAEPTGVGLPPDTDPSL